ncbi:unnamed protein product [Didymodactylos carnosus]|uniref:Uncharacterized protein n=1 Tax=Didymodactylos carnosus TaxID=1234261 RepID=A0A814LQ49_9BILA|nr:unnamed protein product [Didymodactylos carnosus]CAF1395286.1 unnamed protein product [Didymodactylos carnosus]CAF3835890.1 unnamed protein product [Didymodactylos carnosus]CAF4202694.1 unnamed protein product [Didymodactylos carnosus]
MLQPSYGLGPKLLKIHKLKEWNAKENLHSIYLEFLYPLEYYPTQTNCPPFIIKNFYWFVFSEAVRSVFRLSDAKLNIEWPKLHEVFLQKRRNIMRLRNKTTPARGRATTPLETNITSPTTAL